MWKIFTVQWHIGNSKNVVTKFHEIEAFVAADLFISNGVEATAAALWDSNHFFSEKSSSLKNDKMFIVVSVTRCLDYLFNIWSFTTMNFA